MRRLLMLRVVAVALMLAVAGTATAQGGRALGFVRDERGEPIKGASVTGTAENPDTKPGSVTGTTDDKGRFGMLGMRSGLWTFIARAPGYTPQAVSVALRQAPAPSPPLTFTLTRVVAPPSVLGSVEAKDLQTQLSAADDLYDRQQWDAAIAAYSTTLAAAPALSVINLQIAVAYRSKKDFNAAIAAYEDLLKADPSNEKAKIGIAMTNLEKGDLVAAERTLELAAEAPGATREVLYNLGEVKLSNSRTDEALKAYERATQADPAWGKPLFAMGRIAVTAGDADAAARYFQKVIEVDPVSAEAAQARVALAQIKK